MWHTSPIATLITCGVKPFPAELEIKPPDNNHSNHQTQKIYKNNKTRVT
jgi:hypothetical protein